MHKKMYGEGISKPGELIDLGVKQDLVQKLGSWYAMGDVRLGQGREAAKQYLIEHSDIAKELEDEMRKNAFKLESSQNIALDSADLEE